MQPSNRFQYQPHGQLIKLKPLSKLDLLRFWWRFYKFQTIKHQNLYLKKQKSESQFFKRKRNNKKKLRGAQIENPQKTNSQQKSGLIQFRNDLRKKFRNQLKFDAIRKMRDFQRSIKQCVDHVFVLQFLQKVTKWTTNAFNFPHVKNTGYVSNALLKISHIQFTNLKCLKISNGQVISIEAIQWVFCPQLKIMQLNFNLITSLKPLAKTNFPNLSVINLQKNKFNNGETDNFTRMNCTGRKDDIDITITQAYTYRVNDFSFCFKFGEGTYFRCNSYDQVDEIRSLARQNLLAKFNRFQ